MTRRESRWVNVVIIAVVVLLPAPTLLPSMYTIDEAYYATIANEMLDGGAVYRTAVDTRPPGMYYIYAGVFWIFGGNNLFAVHLLANFCRCGHTARPTANRCSDRGRLGRGFERHWLCRVRPFLMAG